LMGCAVIAGAEGGAVAGATVRVAGAVVTDPTTFDTVAVKVDPLSAVVVEGVVYELDVAPLIGAPPLFH
jgi:hypothetical protein